MTFAVSAETETKAESKQSLSAETEFRPKVSSLVSAETESKPKVCFRLRNENAKYADRIHGSTV